MTPQPSHPIVQNVKDVAEVEARWRQGRSTSHQIGHSVVRWVGSPVSLALHLMLFLTWISINLGWWPGVRAFDPYPFSFLSVVVAMEAILLTTLVLIVQNQMSREAERRDHLALQLSMLGEQEMTKMLELLHHISNRLGLNTYDPEAQQLMERTDLEDVVMHIEDKLGTEP